MVIVTTETAGPDKVSYFLGTGKAEAQIFLFKNNFLSYFFLFKTPYNGSIFLRDNITFLVRSAEGVIQQGNKRSVQNMAMVSN